MRRFAVAVAIFVFGIGNAAAGETSGLKILVYGATGKVGTYIVDEALQRGHFVTAVSRDPASITTHHPQLTAVKGDLLDLDSIRNLTAGQDVVIEAVRGVIGDQADPANSLQYRAARNIVQALSEAGPGAARFIHVGGSGSLEVEPGVYYAQKLPKLMLPKGLESEIIGQVWTLDFLREVPDVRWTYVTPPKNFTNGERTGAYRIGGDQLMEDEHGRSKISRADFAVALIDEAERAAHVRERISIAY
jgi:uncharacterized protein